MRCSRWLCCALAALAWGVSAQTAPGPEQFYQDLSFVANELPRLHPGWYTNVSRTDFDTALHRLENEYERLTAEEFYTRLSALIALARDGHTSIYLDSSAAQAAGFVALPVEFRWFADGIFVTAAGANRAALLRARLLGVGGLSIGEATERLKAVLPHENEYFFRFRAPALLRNAGVLRGLGLMARDGPARFQMQLESGEVATAEIWPGTATLTQAPDAQTGHVPAMARRTGEEYWSEYWPAARTVYVRWNRFRAMTSPTAEQFAAATLALVDQNPVETLVIDVRQNTGGDSSLFMPLVMGLAMRSNALRANPRFRMYGLTDGGSYSSSLMAAEFLVLESTLPEWGPLPEGAAPLRAILAGEPTGGKPAHFGEVKNFTLPGSRIGGQYSTQYFSLWPGIPDRDALYPALRVDLRSTDYFARHDPVLAAVMGHVDTIPAAPTGDALVVNGASFRWEQGVAPGSFASAFGVFPAGTVQVMVAGRPAGIVASATSQINFRVPEETPTGEAAVEVRQGEQVAARGRFQVTAAGPGLFVYNAALTSQPGAVLNQDYTLNSMGAPAAQGSVLQIFATGYGPLNAAGEAEVEVWIGEMKAEVLYSGVAPGFPGLWQINARVPGPSPLTGQTPVYIRAHGLVSNAVTVAIKR